MGRIPDEQRLEVVDEHLGHYAQWNAMPGGPFEIEPAFGIAQLQALRDLYHNVQELIAQLVFDLIAARAERDALFGTSSELDEGIWFRLKQYKAMVKARLGARNPLTRTVPNIGFVTPQNYLAICHAFIDHWERVNAALTPDLTIGSFTLANLQAAHDAIAAKITQIDAIELNLKLRREEREQLFGDEPEEVREASSIIAKLLLYHAVVQAMNPNQPIADSLPEIFPVGAQTPLPTFAFNWVMQAGGIVKLWLNPPSPALTDAALLFLKEGATELTLPVTTTTPGDIDVYNFSGVTVVGELDRLELRDGNGITIARGIRDTSLAEPT